MSFFSKEAREERIHKRELSIAEHKQKIAEYDQNIAENNQRIAERNINCKKDGIDKYAIDNLLIPKHTFRFTIISGIDHVPPQTPANIILYNSEQKLEVSVNSTIVLSIPLRSIQESELTTDVEIPDDDVNNKYMIYSHVKYLIDGQEKELVIASFQINGISVSNVAKHNILIFDYALNHLDVSFQKYEEKLRQDAELNAQFRQAITNAQHFSQSQIPPSQVGAPVVSAASELRELKSLLDDGIITQEEYDAKKKQLLNL